MACLSLIHWIVIYPVDSAIQLLNNWSQMGWIADFMWYKNTGVKKGREASRTYLAHFRTASQLFNTESKIRVFIAIIVFRVWALILKKFSIAESKALLYTAPSISGNYWSRHENKAPEILNYKQKHHGIFVTPLL